LGHKRTRFQHAYAEDAISLADLKTRLTELEEERKVAEREFATLKDRRERVEELERDAEASSKTARGWRPRL